MGIIEPPDVFGRTIFCDDIRPEIGGKTSFMGCYVGQLYVHDPFPVVLPKFGFGIAFTQAKLAFDPNILIQIFLPGDSDDKPSGTVEPENIPEGAALAEMGLAQDPESEYITMLANFVWSPLVLTQPGKLRVFAVKGGDRYRLGNLNIAEAPKPPSPPAS